MTRTPVTIRDVWAMIPEMNCKGLCTEACTSIGMSVAEMEIVRERLPNFPGMLESAEALAADPNYSCPALVFGRCIIYADRPTVCRIWGVDERLACPHGCTPKGGHLSKERGSAIMDAAREIGGPPA